ncbi:type II secretion system F family protein [Pseudokineococcus sp. 1T1Z-3]|uniref:type II secretion system F family protein n=1 Tax=Pseudokineococcus sp. 1T1Z-3 TaxID=3132745 RepID=UPI0030AB6EEB
MSATTLTLPAAAAAGSTPWSWPGAGLGLLAGLGLVLVLLRLPAMRRVGLLERVAPYVRDAVPPSRLLATEADAGPLAVVERMLAPVMGDAVAAVEKVLGGRAGVRRRLDQLGEGLGVEDFRAQQVVWGVGGLLLGTGAAAALAGARGVAVVPLALLVLLSGVSGVLLRDWWLSRAVRRREERMTAEFPTVAELLALSVSAGEGAVGALERVSRTCGGELSGELRRTLAEARAGATLVQALAGLADRTSLPSLARFVDGVAVAVERGTPLADVLRAQAQDVRDEGRRALLESGGRKEIAMMAPVVFLVLPITVVFAVYPGLAVLRLDL